LSFMTVVKEGGRRGLRASYERGRKKGGTQYSRESLHSQAFRKKKGGGKTSTLFAAGEGEEGKARSVSSFGEKRFCFRRSCVRVGKKKGEGKTGNWSMVWFRQEEKRDCRILLAGGKRREERRGLSGMEGKKGKKKRVA